MPAIGQGVIYKYRHRQGDPSVLLCELSPGKAGIAVIRPAVGMPKLCVGQPWHTGNEEIAQWIPALL